MSSKAHGTILARNIQTGRTMEIREDMLKISGHHWEVINKEDLSTEASKAEKKNQPKVIKTSKDKPFATENAARSVMTRKNLNEDDWAVLPMEGGFVIAKI
jgi:hypothetical protein